MSDNVQRVPNRRGTDASQVVIRSTSPARYPAYTHRAPVSSGVSKANGTGTRIVMRLTDAGHRSRPLRLMSPAPNGGPHRADDRGDGRGHLCFPGRSFVAQEAAASHNVQRSPARRALRAVHSGANVVSEGGDRIVMSRRPFVGWTDLRFDHCDCGCGVACGAANQEECAPPSPSGAPAPLISRA